MIHILQNPTLPTIYGIQMKNIIPRILYRTGQKTPNRVPCLTFQNLLTTPLVGAEDWKSSESESEIFPPYLHISCSIEAPGGTHALITLSYYFTPLGVYLSMPNSKLFSFSTGSIN